MKAKKEKKTDWRDIFDPNMVHQVIELARDEIKAIPLGVKPTLHIGLRNILMPSLNLYIEEQGDLDLNRSDIDAAYKLYAFVDDLSESLEQGVIYNSDIDKLKELWLIFITEGSAHHVYDTKSQQTANRKSRESARKIADEKLIKAAQAWAELYKKRLAEILKLEKQAESEINPKVIRGYKDQIKQLKSITITIEDVAKESGLPSRTIRELGLKKRIIPAGKALLSKSLS